MDHREQAGEEGEGESVAASMRASLKFAIISLLTFLSISCADKPKAFDYGHIENYRYVNSFFQFTADLPKRWVIYDRSELDAIISRGIGLLDSTSQATMKGKLPAPATTFMLLGGGEQELGTVTYFNANYSIMVSDLAFAPEEIKNEYDFLANLRDTRKNGKMKFDYIDEQFSKRDINGQQFLSMNSGFDIGLFQVNQTILVTRRNNYVLTIMIGYASEIQKEVLDEFINSIQWQANKAPGNFPS